MTVSKADAERFMAVIHKHAETVSMDLLFDLARALGLTVGVRTQRGNPSVDSAPAVSRLTGFDK